MQIIEKSFRFTSEGEMQYRDNGRVVTVNKVTNESLLQQHVSAVVYLFVYGKGTKRILIKAKRKREEG